MKTHIKVPACWEKLVPEGALDVPAPEDLRKVGESDRGQLLHGSQRSVSRARAVLERQIGRRLHRLREKDLLLHLGFRNLGDYAQECLELGRRSAQEMARLAGALEELPAMRRACDDGLLSSSHLRELVRIAEPETEEDILERAQGLTVRELKRFVREEKRWDDERAPSRPRQEDEHDPLTIRFQAPRWFEPKWMDGVELFKKLEGRDHVPVSAAAEAFAAEWLSGAPVPGADRAALERPSEEALEELERKRAIWAATMAWKRARRERQQKDLEESNNKWEKYDTAAELPEWLAKLDGPLSDDPFVLDQELLRLESLRRYLDGFTGRMLVTQSRQGHISPGEFADIEHYAGEMLGLSPSSAAQLSRVERRLGEMPLVQEAYLAGKLGLAKVRQLLRVAATDDEAGWLERARRITVRRLEDEVRCVVMSASLEQSGVDCTEAGEGRLAVLPEGMDIVRHSSALERKLREAPPGRMKPEKATATICFMALPDLARFWMETLDDCRAAEGRWLEEWECADRFIDAFLETHQWDDPRGRTIEHGVMARDGWRCAVPGCGSRQNMHAHHIVWESRGGSDEAWNRTCLCAMHHLQAVHKGRLRVTGRAPDELVWELGVQPDGTALMVVGPGEVVLRRAAREAGSGAAAMRHPTFSLQSTARQVPGQDDPEKAKYDDVLRKLFAPDDKRVAAGETVPGELLDDKEKAKYDDVLRKLFAPDDKRVAAGETVHPKMVREGAFWVPREGQ